jgi:hypothetical protein
MIPTTYFNYRIDLWNDTDTGEIVVDDLAGGVEDFKVACAQMTSP